MVPITIEKGDTVNEVRGLLLGPHGFTLQCMEIVSGTRMRLSEEEDDELEKMEAGVETGVEMGMEMAMAMGMTGMAMGMDETGVDELDEKMMEMEIEMAVEMEIRRHFESLNHPCANDHDEDSVELCGEAVEENRDNTNISAEASPHRPRGLFAFILANKRSNVSLAKTLWQRISRLNDHEREKTQSNQILVENLIEILGGDGSHGLLQAFIVLPKSRCRRHEHFAFVRVVVDIIRCVASSHCPTVVFG